MPAVLFEANSYEQFFVSPVIIRFLVALAAPRPGEKVLDVHLNPQVFISHLNSVVGQTNVQYLQSQATTDEVAQVESSYDVILCSPTFGSSFNTPDGSGEPNEEFWLKWCMNHLSDKGRLAIIVPMGLLSNYSQSSIREFLIADGGIETIIELPSGWAQNAYPQASILYITKNNEPYREIKMLRFTKAESIPWDSLASYIHNNQIDKTKLKSGIGFITNVADLDKRRLDVQYYHLKQAAFLPPDPHIFESVRLSALAKIRSGERFSKDHFQTSGTPFIQVKNVTANGTLDLNHVQTITPLIASMSRSYSKSGDILITTAGTIGKVVLIDDSFSSEGVCIDTSLRKLEVLDTKKVLPEYLTIYLQCPIAQQQMKMLTTGSVIPGLATPNLSELIVYLPSIRKQLEIIAIFKDATIDLETKVNKSFYVEKPESPLMTSFATEAPSIVEIEAESPSLQKIVQLQLPFPIARTHTLFEKSEHQNGNMRVKKMIDLSESIVYYVYNVLVADHFRRLKLDDVELTTKLENSYSSYSVSPRLDVIFHILKLARKQPSVDLFMPELKAIDLGICREIQNHVRNEWSHSSSFPEHKCKQIIKTYQPKLAKLIQSIRFFADYNLMQVTNITIRNSRLQHHVVSLMGDNSLFLPEIEELEKENILLADSLHVILLAKARGYDFLDLHPFYLIHAWEQTGEEDHLCFLKQTVGSSPNLRLKVESTQGIVSTTTETDMGFIDLKSTFKTSAN